MGERIIATRPGTETHALTVIIDGQPVQAYAGDTVAAVLYALGRRWWRAARGGGSRGVFCGMGTCFDCLVRVDGIPGMRACQTLVREGMRVATTETGEK